MGFVESLLFGVRSSVTYLFEECKPLEDRDSACESIAKVIRIKLLGDG